MEKEIKIDSGAVGRLRKKALLYFLLFAGLGIVIAVALALILPSTEKLKGAPANSDSAQKMFRIGYSLVYYSVKNRNRFPSKLSELYKLKYIDDFSIFDSKELPGKVTSVEDIDNGVDFRYLILG